MLRFLYHFLTSNSRHGTHSPFVYELADSVIYNKDFADTVRDGKGSGYHSKGEYLSRAISRKLGGKLMSSDLHANSIDRNTVLIIDISDFKESDLAYLENSCFIQVNNIYQTRENLKKWKSMISNPAIDVSIDLYYFGLLFHRPQQRKENFKLRYPFWIYGF
ncbi:hypothetical protein [Sphingobacterium hungaricum]|uniref:Uncharacterized protein n=1 Tax=Sphingobacterium hungaricum TaxID=2082723 RepID=A0A928V3P6_9SPHI|nr:hypothetical protein [Sphingobacterium hungaricum]MBE8715549.1 hypothetical protein [Sphingobacterium hungaricum]